jgi:hypothetical protein
MFKKCFLILLTVTTIYLFSNDSAFASGGVYLDPSSGEITSDGTSINVVVDTGGVEIDGLEISIEYEGDISFVDFTSGDIVGCEVDGIERETEAYDDIFLYCFIIDGKYSGDSGIFTTLNFKATDNGTAQIKISSIVGLENVEPPPASSYTTTTSASENTSTPSPTPPPSSNQTVLPRTSLPSYVFLCVGAFLLILAPLLKTQISGTQKRSMLEKVDN